MLTVLKTLTITLVHVSTERTGVLSILHREKNQTREMGRLDLVMAQLGLK